MAITDIKLFDVADADSVHVGFFGDVKDRVCFVADKPDDDQRRVIAIPKDRHLCASLARTFMDVAGIRAIRIRRDGKCNIEFGPLPDDWDTR